MKDLMGLMKQAQAMQTKMAEAQAALEQLEVEGQAGGGLVTITLSAKGAMKHVAIDDSLMKADEKEILEDLIVTAHEDARRKAESSGRGEDARRHRRPAAAARDEAAVLRGAAWPSGSPAPRSSG